jgi:hypothetical protein
VSSQRSVRAAAPRRARSPRAAAPWAILVALAALAAPSAAPAFDDPARRGPGRVELRTPEIVRWTGRVDVAAVGRLRALLEANPSVTTLEFVDSPGAFEWGRKVVVEAGALVRERGLATVARGYCISACASIFLAGTTRRLEAPETADATTFLHLHGVYAPGESGPALHEGGTRWLLRVVGERAGEPLPAPLADAILGARTPKGGVYVFRVPTRGAVREAVYACTGEETRIPADCRPYRERTAKGMGLLRD